MHPQATQHKSAATNAEHGASGRLGLTKSIRQRRRKLAAPKDSHSDAYVVAYIRFRVMCTLYPLCRMFANIFLVILNAIQAQIQVTTSQHTHYSVLLRSIHRQTLCVCWRERERADTGAQVYV